MTATTDIDIKRISGNTIADAVDLAAEIGKLVPNAIITPYFKQGGGLVIEQAGFRTRKYRFDKDGGVCITRDGDNPVCIVLSVTDARDTYAWLLHRTPDDTALISASALFHNDFPEA